MRRRRKPEPTIALINVVFLMLVFFLIAGAVAPSLDDRVSLVDTDEIAGRAPPDAAVILADGQVLYQGVATDVAAIIARDPSPRLVPDRELPARDLIALTRALQEAGAEEVWIITERGLE